MSSSDWVVLALTLLGILAYGVWKSRSTRDLTGYFLGNRSVPWYIVLFSIMGTQASAVTFLSAPGQAFSKGMAFVQMYFGLPLAMVVIAVSFVPVFRRLRIITAYEFIEKRFDLKTRTLTASLFLLQRGVSTGISIAAPAIIVSSLLGWNIFWTNLLMGGLLIIYTVTGGAKAVAYTQQLQLIVIFAGMALAGYLVVHKMPADIGFIQALQASGQAGKLNPLTTALGPKGFDWKDTYNLFSGLIGGFFLALSYFGTDQVQVGRYLTARSIQESKMGLLLNGLVKIPMQFFILLIGSLIFVFYQYQPEPLFFNGTQIHRLEESRYKDSLAVMSAQYDALQKRKVVVMSGLGADALRAGSPSYRKRQEILREVEDTKTQMRGRLRRWMEDPQVGGNSNDTNYVFLHFVLDYLPHGLVGLLIAVIILAAWGSNAAALNALASSTIVDFQKRFSKKINSGKAEVRLSQWYTLAWGIFCIAVAQMAYNIGNSLIEAVNKLGSLFYGVVLGIFLVAFYFRSVRGNAVFWSAVISEGLVITIHLLNESGRIGLSYLWLNLIGAALVIFLALLFSGPPKWAKNSRAVTEGS